MARRKKKKIVVKAPVSGSGEPELIADTTNFETLDVLKASEKIGRVLSYIMIPIGVLFSLLSLYGILISARFSFSDQLFIGALGFLGVINILCGLILLARK